MEKTKVHFRHIIIFDRTWKKSWPSCQIE